jgi:molybdate transport system regulatory protein
MRPARDESQGKRRAGAGARAGADAPKLRGRLWVEADAGVALTDAGADLLEQIQVVGSLSEAARRLRFSYRRAWMLADAMNRRWPRPLMTLSTGGRKGGGARLTELGRDVVRAYRDLQLRFEHFLDTSAPAFNRATRTRRG